jgi:sugar fermentation stimulation protein A
MTKLLDIPVQVECLIRQRINRFVVEVEVEGKTRRAHINNTGRLREFLVSGRKAFCIPKDTPKTQYQLFAVEEGGLAALIDTALQMRAFEQLVSLGIKPWDNFRILRRSPRLYSSVFDYEFERLGEDILVEVKSAVLRENSYAMYPDCPTERGRRQIKELIRHVESGRKGLIVFIAALPNVEAFKPYVEGDSEVARLLRIAKDTGVEIRAISMHYEPIQQNIVLDNPDLPVFIPP